MELEDLKQGWKEMETRLERMEWQNKELMRQIAYSKVESAQQKLKKNYQRMTLLCLFAPFWSQGVYRLVDGTGLGAWPFWLFFFAMAYMKGRMWRMVARLDCQSLTVKEALLAVYRLERWQHTTLLVGPLLALPLLAWFGWLLYQTNDMYLLGGAGFGLIVGGAIGWCVRLRLHRSLRQMREVLAEELE